MPLEASITFQKTGFLQHFLDLAGRSCLWHNNLMSRWILFFITVALGLGAGLYYGWRIDPVEYVDTTPETLRDDYKTDYVLMVAETYQVEKNLDLAVQRLAALGSQEPGEQRPGQQWPGEIVAAALQYAATIKPPYAEADLALMRRLSEDLKPLDPAEEAQGQ
jgi:hypothetical protein